jgi:homoserine kinase
MDHVTIQVPASTSNLGSGFDTLGLAVKLYTRLEVWTSSGKGVELEGDVVPADFVRLFAEASQAFFRKTEHPPIGLRLRVSGNVPIARGLGYSATVRVALLAALNELTARKLPRSYLLNIATELEHHPDNASPSIYGGFTVSGTVDGEVTCLRFSVSSTLRLVTLVPNFPVSTEEARKLMPASYSKADAAHALNRAALITAAFSSGHLERLAGLFDDRIHQPYRAKLIPQLDPVIRAGQSAGALGGFLSGSGSAIICLALPDADRVASAMHAQLPDAQISILSVDNEGYKIL